MSCNFGYTYITIWLVSVEAEFDLLAGRIIVGSYCLQPVATYLALDGGCALLASAGGAGLTLSLAVLGAAATDLRLHLGDLDGQLAVERVAAGLHRHVAQTDADLRVL